MKKLALVSIAMVLLAACGSSVKKSDYVQKDGVEILCFHTAQRCATCRAIEKGAQSVADQYANQIASGRLRLRTIDLTTDQGEELGDRYQVTSTSLLLTRWSDGKEIVENVTTFAFTTARSNPDTFCAGLKTKIDNLLKE